MKIISQLIIIVGAFFATWLLLSQINFITADGMESFSKKSEKKLGELILESIQRNDQELISNTASAYIDSIGRRLCEANQIAFDSIRIHVIINDQVNAFALPDRQMIIFTGLIIQSKNPEEVAGVMAHEIGHMEKNHVMKKLGKEVGLAMLLTLVDGANHMEIAREMTHMLSSSAFDRSQEKEADQFAVEAMAKADIDPEYMANFLFRLSRKDNTPEELVWLTTHPRGEVRAADVLKLKKEQHFTARPILKSSWDEVKKEFSRASEK